MGILGRIMRYPHGAALADSARDIIPRAARHAPAGAVLGAAAGGAMSPEDQPAFQTAENMAGGLGLGAMAGAGIGGGRAMARIIGQIAFALKKQRPELDDMTAWALAERHAHDSGMIRKNITDTFGDSI